MRKTLEEKIHISRGNIKVKCPIFNLPSRLTCKPGVKCHKMCYSRKAEYLYPRVRPCRIRNLRYSRSPNFVEAMINKITQSTKKYFRLHESGDFYSSEYINKWYSIIKHFPDKIFYAYTKRDDLFTRKSLSRRPPNLVLIYSFDEVDKFPDPSPYLARGFDKVAYVTSGETNCAALRNKLVKCIRDCTTCPDTSKTRVIKFRKH